MIEVWFTCWRHPNYEVSTSGRVRNKRNGRILKPSYNKPGGYLRVCLDKKNESVHRLLMKSIYKIDGEGLEVNHKDGNHANNNLANLEWCSKDQNTKHAVENGFIVVNKVRVIRCAHCKYRDDRENCKGLPDDFYCADGEL